MKALVNNNMDSILKKCSLFSGLAPAELEQIRIIAKAKHYARQEIIFSEGEPATGFYVIWEGKIKLYKLSAAGKEQILHLASAGECVAEAAMFSGTSYPATAEALTQTKLLYFPKADFLRLIKENPQLSLNMIATLSKLLRRFNRLVEELALKDVSARLARYLVELTLNNGLKLEPKTTVELDMSKSQLAAKLGTISETLSRTLKKLAENQVIQVKKNKITILDPQALHDISEA